MSLTTSFSKTKRKIQKAVTGETPQIDILDTLKEEHEEVAALLKQLVDSDSGSGAQVASQAGQGRFGAPMCAPRKRSSMTRS